MSERIQGEFGMPPDIGTIAEEPRPISEREEDERRTYTATTATRTAAGAVATGATAEGETLPGWAVLLIVGAIAYFVWSDN